MRLNLQELLCGDGVIPFTCEMDPAGLEFPSITEYLTPITATGRVTSQADVLTLTGETRAKLRCICDRCGREYEREAVFPLDTVLAAELEDEENPDVFLLQDEHLRLLYPERFRFSEHRQEIFRSLCFPCTLPPRQRHTPGTLHICHLQRNSESFCLTLNKAALQCIR